MALVQFYNLIVVDVHFVSLYLYVFISFTTLAFFNKIKYSKIGLV